MDAKAARGTGHLHSFKVSPQPLLTHKGGSQDAGKEAASSATARPAGPRPRDEGWQAPVRVAEQARHPPAGLPPPTLSPGLMLGEPQGSG